MKRTATIERPVPSEYNEYYDTYVGAVPEGDVLEFLRRGAEELPSLLDGIDDERSLYRYADGKWTLKEVVGHVVDVEWVFTYRALRFARADATPLPGMDQDVFAAAAGSNDRPLATMLTEFRHLRAASTTLFESFDAETLDRRGTASGCEFTVRAIAYILAGHELHHRRVLRERYLT